MRGIIAIDPNARIARVEPGVVLDDLRQAAAPHGLTFGPDPSMHKYCTIGGMIGNNSCGVHSVMAALHGTGPTTADNLEALEVITADGTRLRAAATDDSALAHILAEGGPRADLFRRLKAFRDQYAEVIRHDFPRLPRRVSGYNLPALLPEHGFHVGRALAGSESTLVLGFSDIFVAADHVPKVMGWRPVGLEGFDAGLADDLRRAGLNAGHLRLLPEGKGWLLVEFGGDTQEEALAQAHAFTAGVRRFSTVPSVAVFEDPEDQDQLWEIRESGLAATARVAGESPTWPGWEDWRAWRWPGAR